MQAIYLGLMSGTSQDGVDVAAVEFGERSVNLLATRAHPFDDALRGPLNELALGGSASLAAIGRLDAQLGELFARAALALLADNPELRSHIQAIGSHGHTAWHQPPVNNEHGFTIQLGDPNIIAARTGITTVADLRRMDMAFGGQGAPLAPAFHQWLWAAPQRTRVVANLGGIANITILNGEAEVSGFDTGPGNSLLDHWAQRHLGKPYDAAGSWAQTGALNDNLLGELMADAYFRQPPPKSTGREYFNLARYANQVDNIPPADVARTLLEVTVQSLGDAIRTYAHNADEIILVGGGSHNDFLRQRLADYAALNVTVSDLSGLPADWVEAAAFAWLARTRLAGGRANLPSVTGARQSTSLGGVYCPD
ncbi:MAG: anhydro-N-acetylmuramic acid kinase [Gammaproteobacteria bacterium]